MWIAFIFSTFGITQQLSSNWLLNVSGCELLSYSVPLVLHNNTLQGIKHHPGLWIAFIFSTFGITQQHYKVGFAHCSSCELLSYSVPLVLHNNLISMLPPDALVVNCFHIQYLWYYTTTFDVGFSFFLLLWIAFIFSTFGITQQQRAGKAIGDFCCELLSYSVPLVLHNNPVLIGL